jgi:signal peptidase II
MIWMIIVIAAVILDQTTKYIVSKNIEPGQLIPVIDNFFYLTYHENKGAAWGILQGRRYLFIILTLVVSIVMAYYLIKTDSKYLKFSLSLILGGAFGNLIGRISKGSVADFLDFHFGKYNFPTFNVADICITVGTCILAYYLLFIYKEPIKLEK